MPQTPRTHRVHLCDGDHVWTMFGVEERLSVDESAWLLRNVAYAPYGVVIEVDGIRIDVLGLIGQWLDDDVFVLAVDDIIGPDAGCR